MAKTKTSIKKVQKVKLEPTRVPVSEPGVMAEIAVKDIPVAIRKPYGVLLFATGNAYYTLMAVRLAVSIHATNPEGMNIAICVDETCNNSLLKQFSKLFDEIILLDNKILLDSGDVLYAKLNADLLSPYDKTLMLDVDMLMLPGKGMNLTAYFIRAEAYAFYVQNRGFCNVGDEPKSNEPAYWAYSADIAKAYRLTEGKIYHYMGEWVYFDRSVSTIGKYFELCRTLYKEKAMDIEVIGNMSYNEEVVYAVASNMLSLYPSTNDFTTFWEQRVPASEHRMDRLELSKKYYAISLGGSFISNRIKTDYEDLIAAYIYKFQYKGIPRVLHSKRTALTDR
jgi:hypothetical protein